MKKSYIVVSAVFFLIANALSAQDLISSQFLKEMTAASVEMEFGIPAEFDIEFYSIEYTTKDLNEVQDTASGLLIVPADRDFTYPMLSYAHGTLPDRNTGMSNLTAADVDLATIYASFGFTVVAPDFLGVLSSRGFHPYVHAASESSATIDMMLAVKNDALPMLDIISNNRTFITGYSQGGHAAMATHRDIQANYSDEFNVIAGFPMSGPYSISEKMIDFTLGDEEYFFCAYLPNVALSYKAAYPQLLADVELEDIFKSEYIADINKFKNEEIDLFELNTNLINLLIVNEGASIPSRMLHDSTVYNLKNVPSAPLSMALADNDTYDWSPESFMVMYYCLADDQVTYENALLAEQVMVDNGAGFTSSVNISDTEDHTGCVIPAVTTALSFIYIMRGITSGNTELLDRSQYQISPNPANDNFEVNLDPSISFKNGKVSLIDMHGKLIMEQVITGNKSSVDISSLANGMYLVELETEDHRGIQRLIKN